MAEFHKELPDEVDVQTVTFIGFADRRPSEMVMASTVDPGIAHRVLNERGESILTDALVGIVLFGLSNEAP